MKRVMLRRVYGSCMAFWGRLALGNGLLYKYRAVYIRWVMQRAMNSIIAISRWNKTPYQCFKHPELLNRLLLNVEPVQFYSVTIWLVMTKIEFVPKEQ